jgi:hypothetical protein
MSRNSEALNGEALMTGVKTLRSQTPLFCDALQAATNGIGRNDAVGLFIESSGDERGQLTAFLDDFGTHDD